MQCLQTEWLNTRAGRALLEQECLQAAQALERIFGDQIVQIGTWGLPGQLLAAARTQAAFTLAMEPSEGVDALLAPDRLALLSDSVDAVLLPHTLEFSPLPHAVLREVCRVLRPGGKLIVLGFNPFGWIGLRHQVALAGYPPGSSRHISRQRLSDWLDLLNFTVDFVSPCYLSVPRHGVLRWLQRTGLFAGAYQLVATKQSIPMTVIRPRLKRVPAMVGGLVKPTTRNAA